MKLFALWALALTLSSVVSAQSPRTFTVAAQTIDGVILRVPPSTSDNQLAVLVLALRSARKDGTLVNFFPPTTPASRYGPYAGVQVFVMSDGAWATAARLTAFIHASGRLRTADEKAFARRVRAYYLAPIAGEEFGSVGYEDDDLRYRTPNFRKLF